MSKPETKTVKLLGLSNEEGAYCLSEYEMTKDAFMKHAKRISRTEPDQFAILLSNITKKARELLEI